MTRNGHAGVFQRRHQPGAVLNGTSPYKAQKKPVERLSALAQGEPVQIAHSHSLKLSGPLRVIWTRPAMGVVQKVTQRPERALPARRRDV